MTKKVFDTRDDVSNYNRKQAIPKPKKRVASPPICDKCDSAGGVVTYANQAVLPLNGRTVCVDFCIHHIVAALNAGGVETVACCCGHGVNRGRIDLKDGRVLHIETPTPKERDQ